MIFNFYKKKKKKEKKNVIDGKRREVLRANPNHDCKSWDGLAHNHFLQNL